jgi:hypothetical protein
MSKQNESNKLNRLEINKETVRDLDPNNAGEVRGGTQLVMQTDPITAPTTDIGYNRERTPAFSQTCK